MSFYIKGFPRRDFLENDSPIARRTDYPLLFNRDGTPHKAYYSVINVPGGKR